MDTTTATSTIEDIRHFDDDISVATALLENKQIWEKAWNFEDDRDRVLVIQAILDAEIRIREIPLRIKETELRPVTLEAGQATTELRLKLDNELKLNEMKVGLDREIARLQARTTEKVGKAPYRWRIHAVWAASALIVFFTLKNVEIPIPHIAFIHETTQGSP